MADVVELKMARLGDVLSGYEEKADDEKPAKGKGGKKRPLPPWLKEGDDEKPDADDSTDADEDEEKPSKKPAKGKVPPQFAKGKGEKAAKPGKGFRPRQTEQGGAGRKPAVTARRNRTGAEVQPIAWAGGSEGGSRRRRRGGVKAARGAARITTWGPVNQHVDVRRGRGDGVMDQGPSDARLRRASREEDTDGFRPRRGGAGGNGVTRGNSGAAIQENKPGRLKKRGNANDGWSPSADVGEGRRGGRSGSAMVPNKPGNVRKDLWSYDVDEVKSAMAVVQKALNGLASDLTRD